MVPSGRHISGSQQAKTNLNQHLRVYKDLKCPNCSSDIYWGTHKCRRCGRDFPEGLTAEIDRRKMMHYIPIEYGSIVREHWISNIIIATIVALLLLLVILFLTAGVFVSNIRMSYVVTWAFFVTILTSAMLIIFNLADTRNKMLNKSNLLYTIFLMGLSGIVIGFVGLIQIGVYGANEFELVVCATFIILAAVALAGARTIWPIISITHGIFIGTAAFFLGWLLLRTSVKSHWIDSVLYSAGNPAGTVLVLIIGLIALLSGSYLIFHGTPFQIRMSNCYPTMFTGLIFLSIFSFFRAALFRPELYLTYLEALIFILGLFLTGLGLLLFIRKKYVDFIIQSHLNRTKLALNDIELKHSNGKFKQSLELYEKLLNNNPALVFGSSNSHPILELLGINFIHSMPPKRKETKSSGPIHEKNVDEVGKSAEEDKKKDVKEEPDEIEAKGIDNKATDVESDVKDEVMEPFQSKDDKEEEDEEDPELIQAEALALLKKSSFYEQAGQRYKALSCIERSIKLDRSRPESWIQLGNITSKIGMPWEKIKGYYEWVVDLKLKAVSSWVEQDDVPPQYALWLLEELALLKRIMMNIGRTHRTLRRSPSKA
jgi:tetratricopeptide (TPR) repeat protein